ncbi:hypothetical protein LTS08_007166 [Lithohypha guttulata]|nr:hypothetical protein LTS08_007166 [Lithohypha guttulata]
MNPNHRRPRFRGPSSQRLGSPSSPGALQTSPPVDHDAGPSLTRSPSGVTRGFHDFSIAERSLQTNAARRRTRGKASDPLGLTLLHEPEHEPLADIVFVHGVGGGSQSTWTTDDDTETLWPQEWLPADQVLSSARISTFGYSVQLSALNEPETLDFSGWAKELLLNLHFKTGREAKPLKIGAVPLLFVGHGLGGLVVKKAYLLGRNNTNADFSFIAHSVAAFIFFATPHRGVHIVEVLKDVLSACIPDWALKLEWSQLTRQSQILDDINRRFEEQLPYVDIVSFYEKQLTHIGRSLVHVLRQDLATLGHQTETCIELDANHLSITRSASDSNYGRVLDLLRYIVEKVRSNPPESVSNQSDEEELNRVSYYLGVEGAPEDDHNWFADKRVHGTCEFVLEHDAFTSWLEDNSGKVAVLWCHGKAGSGKSVTTSYIINHLVEKDLPCAYYYFRSGDQVKNNLTLFLLSMAFQIAAFNAEYRRKLCRLEEDGFNISKAGYKMLWKKLFVSILLKMQSKAPPVYLVVDGLDELDTAMAKELISKLFVDLAEAKQLIRLLIVSRPIPDIESAIDRLARHLRPATALRRMAFDGHKDDLELYVEEEMEAMFGEDAFKQQTLLRVLQKADGNFLWVHLVVQEILECTMEDDVENALNTVPQSLGPLYARMDQRLADAVSHRPNDKLLGQTILTWACCSRYPLLLEELTEALLPEFAKIIDIRQTVQKLCGEFVIVDKRDHISTMHASARDYLLSQSDLNFHIEPEKAHQGLFRKCTQKLQACHINVRHMLTKPRGFVRYAAESWPFHLNTSRGWLDQDSLTVLVAFFHDRAVLDWICILGSMNRLRVLVDASKALIMFVKLVESIDQARSPLQHRLTDREYILAWAQDLVRIVGKFGTQVVRHPTSIYELIPAFCPQNTAMYKEFAADNSGIALSVRGSISQDWDDCLAKFAVPGQSLPQIVTALERHFAILTTDGVVRLFYSNTCEEARIFVHGETVLAMCFNAVGDRLATCGFYKTKIWDTKTARHLFTIENPQYSKALAICFRMLGDSEEVLLMFSDDTLIRSCSMAATYFAWTSEGPCRVDTDAYDRMNSPSKAHFAPDGSLIAVSYRGMHPAVWSLQDGRPEFLAECDKRPGSHVAYAATHAKFVDAQAFSWHPVSGYLLGTYNDGCVFKWHPTLGEYQLSDIRSSGIKCNADGKFFVTSSGDGTLRIWDFEHFSPIYQLSYPQGIRDIDIDRNEARIYDIRDMYCHAWQPNALLRLLESDDKSSDTKSSRDSTNQLSLAEAKQESIDPITALSVLDLQDSFVTGDEAGGAYLYNFHGQKVSTLIEGYMGIEYVASCEKRAVVAIADLGRDVTITSLDNNHDSTTDTNTISSWTTSEPDRILQLLFNAAGTKILVFSTSALRVYNVDDQRLLGVYPDARNRYWVNHPEDESLLLGFGSDHLTIIPWDDLIDGASYIYDRPAESNAAPFMRAGSRRPSEAFPLSPSETDATTEKVLMSSDHKHFFVQVSCSTNQTVRRTDFFLVELQHIQQAVHSAQVPIRPLPPDFIELLSTGLGFVAVDHTVISQSRRSSTAPVLASRRSVPRPHLQEQTFAFVDKNFWVSTINLALDSDRPLHVRKHFFLPRDWQNAEWLALATVTRAGALLCPRNGEIAVVSDGLAWEWTDD